MTLYKLIGEDVLVEECGDWRQIEGLIGEILPPWVSWWRKVQQVGGATYFLSEEPSGFDDSFYGRKPAIYFDKWGDEAPF